MSLDRVRVFETISLHQQELRNLGVRNLKLFGSAARNEFGANSDLDFLVELSANTFDSYMGVKLFLEDLFGRTVDLVLEASIKPCLRDHIQREAIHAPGF